MSSLDHILLYLFIFIFISLWSNFNSHKLNVNYWITAICPILLVSVITGCRYWGADYLWYKYQYEHLNTIDIIIEQKSQPIFYALNCFLNYLGLNYVGAYIVYSLIYFIGAFHLLHYYGKESKYMYWFITFAFLGFATGIIRQGIAIGVIMFSLPYLYKKKYILFAICSLVAINIHTATVMLIGVLVLFYKYINVLVRPLYPIIFYLFITYIYNIGDIGFIGDFVQILSFDNTKFQGYVDNTDVWFSKDAQQKGYTQGAVALFLETLYIISFFYIGYLALKIKYNKEITCLYNVTVVGYILLRMFFNFELIRRFTMPMTIFYPISLGYAIYVLFPLIKDNRLSKRKMKYVCWSLGLISLYMILYWGRFTFLNPDSIFIWSI